MTSRRIPRAKAVHLGTERNIRYLAPPATCSPTTSSFRIEIQQFALPNGQTLRRHTSLVLLAEITESRDSYIAEVPGLDIPLAAITPQEMQDAIEDLIPFLWQQYALEDDSNLTPKARTLKARLLTDYAVIS